MRLEVELMNLDARCPTLGSEECAGYDLYSYEEVIIMPEKRHLFSLGIKVNIPKCTREGWVNAAMILDRSSMGLRGIIRLAGLIDQDYKKEWKVILHNTDGFALHIKPGERIAQFVITEVMHTTPVVVTSVNDNGRGGFGSTGK